MAVALGLAAAPPVVLLVVAALSSSSLPRERELLTLLCQAASGAREAASVVCSPAGSRRRSHRQHVTRASKLQIWRKEVPPRFGSPPTPFRQTPIVARQLRPARRLPPRKTLSSRSSLSRTRRCRRVPGTPPAGHTGPRSGAPRASESEQRTRRPAAPACATCPRPPSPRPRRFSVPAAPLSAAALSRNAAGKQFFSTRRRHHTADSWPSRRGRRIALPPPPSRGARVPRPETATAARRFPPSRASCWSACRSDARRGQTGSWDCSFPWPCQQSLSQQTGFFPLSHSISSPRLHCFFPPRSTH
mmetsp:Transcript_21566/g.54428  ORF Transcript_21566/g.54428 Transcript_21566/m.54428 type:complete len:303 (-) Transcript_21566:2162-3070(-)